MEEDRKLSTRDIAVSATEAPPQPVERQRTDQGVARGEESGSEREAEPLFPVEEGQGYRSRWDAVQTGFVDEPRKAVEEADHLVADVMKRLAGVFADERSTLEAQWSKGDQVSTEDLRVALRRYRTFFQRLLDI